MNANVMTTGQVARRFGISEPAVRKLDDVLAPTRLPFGMRVYDPATVERVAAERAQRRAAQETTK